MEYQNLNHKNKSLKSYLRYLKSQRTSIKKSSKTLNVLILNLRDNNFSNEGDKSLFSGLSKLLDIQSFEFSLYGNEIMKK